MENAQLAADSVHGTARLTRMLVMDRFEAWPATRCNADVGECYRSARGTRATTGARTAIGEVQAARQRVFLAVSVSMQFVQLIAARWCSMQHVVNACGSSGLGVRTSVHLATEREHVQTPWRRSSMAQVAYRAEIQRPPARSTSNGCWY